MNPHGVKQFKRRCQFLDDNGKRCRKEAVWCFSAHLDSELYDYPKWVAIECCHEHSKHYGFDPYDLIASGKAKVILEE